MKVQLLKILDWSRWTFWVWRPFLLSKRRLKISSIVRGLSWILTRLTFRILLLMLFIVKDGRLVHSSSNLPVCRNICGNWNLALLRIWLRWMLFIVRDLWITFRTLSTVSMAVSLLSMIFLLWRNIWKIHMVLRYIRSRSCFCHVCWRILLVANPMPCVKQWVKNWGTN